MDGMDGALADVNQMGQNVVLSNAAGQF